MRADPKLEAKNCSKNGNSFTYKNVFTEINSKSYTFVNAIFMRNQQSASLTSHLLQEIRKQCLCVCM